MGEIRTIPPKLKKTEWNALLDHALEKGLNYIVRKSGSYFEGVHCSTGLIDFGGSGNSGGVDGSNADDVIQACLDAMTNGGTIMLKLETDWNVSTTISMTYAYTNLIFNGKGFLKSIGLINEPIISLQAQYCSIINIHVGGNDEAYGLEIKNGTHYSLMRGGYILNCVYSIYFNVGTSSTHNIKFDLVRAYGFDCGIKVNSSNGGYVNDIKVIDCPLMSIKDNAIGIEIGGVGSASLWRINRSYIQASGANGIGISVGAKNMPIITQNRIEACSVGIYLTSGHTNLRLFNNYFDGCTTPIDGTIAVTDRIKYNQGYKTEAEGHDTIANGTNYVTITHGLGGTPYTIDVVGTSAEVADVYVANVGDTTFDIYTASGNVSADRVVYWKAYLRYAI